MISLLHNRASTGLAAWPGDALPSPSGAGFASRNLDEIRAHMSRVFCPHALDHDGKAEPLDFRHRQANLRALSFNATRYGGSGGRIKVDIPPCDDLYLIQFSLSGSAEIRHQGCTVALAPNSMCMLHLHEGATVRFDSSYAHFTVKIPGRLLSQLLEQEVGRCGSAPVFTPQPVVLEGHAASFSQLVELICADIDNGTGGYLHQRVIDSTEQMLVRLLLVSLPHSYSEAFAGRPGAAKPYYVRRVEEYLRAHVDEPISLVDLIAVSGVSARSLHAGFRRHVNDTPLNYLKKLRLDNARRSLLEGGEDVSVTDVAFGVGFTHLSKFARDYRHRFGEAPSETLRRSMHG